MTPPRSRRVATVLLVAAAFACAAPAPVSPPAPVEAPYVVLVSFDGMRYDFIDRADAPSFQRVAAAGVRAAGLIPGYPSKTFPNHYGIATGLYPSNHGLVDNSFYDPELDTTYTMWNRAVVEDGRFYRGEPIWVTAERQGVRTASYFWVGTEAPIQGVRPTYFKFYDGSVPYAARVDTVLHWLSLPPAERPRLVLLYFDEPDHTAHEVGPDDPAVDSVVAMLDGHLGRLLDGVEALPIASQVNFVLVSDHGMEAVPADHVIVLDDHADLQGVRVVTGGTQALLYFGADTARAGRVHHALAAGLEHATVYRREDTPHRWRYDHGRRIGDLVVAADPGWVIQRAGEDPWAGGGQHGYDPYHRAMQGIFLAAGPAVTEAGVIPAFENVHVYPFLARILALEPAPDIDGSLDVLTPFLRDPAVRSP